jgi:hypothetical protein
MTLFRRPASQWVSSDLHSEGATASTLSLADAYLGGIRLGARKAQFEQMIDAFAVG